MSWYVHTNDGGDDDDAHALQVLMNLQLHMVDSINYLVDSHHRKTYGASTEPGAWKFNMANPDTLLPETSSDGRSIKDGLADRRWVHKVSAHCPCVVVSRCRRENKSKCCSTSTTQILQRPTMFAVNVGICMATFAVHIHVQPRQSQREVLFKIIIETFIADGSLL